MYDEPQGNAKRVYFLLLTTVLTACAILDYWVQFFQPPYNVVFYFFLSTVVQCIAAHDIYVRVWRAFLNHRIHHEAFYLVSTILLFTYSFIAMATGGFVDSKTAFWSLCTPMIMILCLLIRNFFEAKIHHKADACMHELRARLAVLPKVFHHDGSILIQKGDIIPYDGIIVQGGSFIDEYMVTRAQVPVWKTVSRNVFAGTINKTDSFYMRVTAVGDNTVLGHVVERMRHVHAAILTAHVISKKRAFWSALACVMALLVFLWSLNYGLSRSVLDALWAMISVFVALDLIFFPGVTALPLLVGFQEMAKRGIVLHDARDLEVADTINVVVLDQTLFEVFPHGELYCDEVAFSSTVLDSDGQEFILSALVSLASCSDTLLGRSLVHRFGPSVSVHDVSSFVSENTYLKGIIKGHVVMITRESDLIAQGTAGDPLLTGIYKEWSEQKALVMHCVIDGVVVALVKLVQLFIPATGIVLKKLQALKIQPCMERGFESVYQACASWRQQGACIAAVTDTYDSAYAQAPNLCIVMHPDPDLTSGKRIVFLRDDSLLIPEFFGIAQQVAAATRDNIYKITAFSFIIFFQVVNLSLQYPSLMIFPGVMSVMVLILYGVIFSNSARIANYRRV